MSPTENELRAALRHGEGDGPDPFVIAAAGARARARRRSRLVNTAAAVVLIGGLGTVGTFLVQNTGTDEQGGKSNDMGAAAKAPNGLTGQSGAGGAKGGSVQTRSAPVGGAHVLPPRAAGSASSCPDTAPAVPAPGAAGGSGALFPQAPVELVVCTYTTVVSSAGPDQVVLTGADARAVVASLDAASTTRPTGMCPNYRLAGERTVQIIGRSASGASVGAVTATLDRPACATVVTNGTAVRYGWAPPQELLRAVGPLGGRSHGPVAQASSPSR